MKRVKNIILLILVISFVLSCVPITFAENENLLSSMTPLQESLNSVEQTEEESETELSPEEQAIIDEINNNSVTVYNNDIPSEADSISEDTTSVLMEAQEAELMTASTGVISDEFKVEPVASVYNVLNNNNDYVSQATGALTYEKNLLSLPGANGLDLNLSVRYNSNEAVITQNEFADTNEEIRKINFNSFAAGWSFGFPTIEKNNVEDSFGWKEETNISFSDGSGYKITNDTDNPSEDTILTLQYYKLSDMTLIKKAETNDYELTYSNGNVYTFDGTYGNIKKIKDIHNNEINFYYTEIDYYRGSFLDYMFNPSYYNAKINALTQIVDSTGRAIDIEYDIDNTINGKELRKIIIKIDNEKYAILELERVKNYEGSGNILSKITDGEGYATKFFYDEKITHIYNSDSQEPTYTVNGSIIALTKVILPTGGYINYEYIKARRTYVYYFTETLQYDWYEVYKISKVSDSSGFERTYEYENDRSGYPFTYLDVDPSIVSGGAIYGETTTGYVADRHFRYLCMMKQNGKTTITVFDYQHNKVREQTYEDTNNQTLYVAGNGITKWNVLIGDCVYRMGYLNTNPNTTFSKTFLYKQNIITGETILLTPYSEAIPQICQVKSYGKYIYVFLGPMHLIN